MAINKWGPTGPFIGKLGGSIGYIRRGTPVVRALPHPSRKPRSIKQKASNQAFSLVMKFVPPFNDFIAYSYHPATIGMGAIPQNGFTKYLRNHCIAGEYPDQYIDCTKVKVSLGNITPPLNAAAALEGNQLRFRWAVDPDWDQSVYADQVMLLAYYPYTKRAAFAIGNVWKYEGEAVLPLLPDYIHIPGGVPVDDVETYIAFISNDRQRVSDSVYTGQINL